MTFRELMEFCFVNEQNIRQAIWLKRNDKVNVVTGGGGSGKYRMSDPTAAEGIRNAEEIIWVWVEYGGAIDGHKPTFKLYNPEKWLQLIERVQSHYEGTKYEKLIILRYKESRTRRYINTELNVSPATVTIMVDKVVEYAKGLADGLGIHK